MNGLVSALPTDRRRCYENTRREGGRGHHPNGQELPVQDPQCGVRSVNTCDICLCQVWAHLCYTSVSVNTTDTTCLCQVSQHLCSMSVSGQSTPVFHVCVRSVSTSALHVYRRHLGCVCVCAFVYLWQYCLFIIILDDPNTHTFILSLWVILGCVEEFCCCIFAHTLLS